VDSGLSQSAARLFPAGYMPPSLDSPRDRNPSTTGQRMGQPLIEYWNGTAWMMMPVP